MAFYERFEWLCGEKGVTPTQAARDVGIRQSVVSMWKKRGSTPKGSTLNKLAAYFEISTDYLLGNVVDASKLGCAIGTRFSAPCDNPVAKIAEYAMPMINPLTPENLAIMAREQDLRIAFRKLNPLGQIEAVHRIEELTEIPRYRAETAPHSTPVPQDAPEQVVTTPPTDAPGEAQEDE